MKHIRNKKLLTSLSVITVLCVSFLAVGLIKHVPIPAYVTLSQNTLDSSSGQISNTSITCIDEENYKHTMTEIVEPYLDYIKTAGYISSFDNAKLYYEYYTVENPIGTVVISHGFTDALEKYNEMIYYFTQSGYSTYIVQHRGHGLSMRYTNDASLVYIDDFNTYVEDFDSFISSIVAPTSQSDNHILFAHSMGGCIGAMYLAEHPGFFDRAILTSPMFQINTGKVPAFAAKTLASAASLTKHKYTYVMGNTAYDYERDFESSNYLSESRYHYIYDITDANVYYHTNAASYGWLNAAMNAADYITKKSIASKITIPILLFQAENDAIVKPYGQYKFVNNSGSTSMVLVKDGKHDLFSSHNEALQLYLNKVFNFIK